MSPDEQPVRPSGPKHSHRQTLSIVIGIVVAVLFAVVLPLALTGYEMLFGLKADCLIDGVFRPSVAVLDLGGQIFLRLLKMIVVPLVIASVMTGILGMGDVRKLGRPGLRTVVYYLATTVLAVILGIVLVNVIQPGVGLDKKIVEDARTTGEKQVEEIEKKIGAEEAPEGIGYVLKNLVLMLFTDNLFEAIVKFELLPLIVFSIVFAALLTTMGARADPITRLVVAVNDALLSFVLVLMRLAPVGIFCLVAGRFGQAQLEGNFATVLQQIAYFVLAVLVGLAIHAFVTLPLIYYLVTRRNPYRFMLDMMQALLTAFSTASSSATLPVTMECATDKAGVSRRSVDFVLPLGATINMDGTALYEACAAIFIAQAYALVDPTYVLTFDRQIVIAVTATLAAIGAAGIPEAGLVTMLIVLAAVGLPEAYIGLVLPVDWFLDRFRTAVNVFGDSVGAAVVEKGFPD